MRFSRAFLVLFALLFAACDSSRTEGPPVSGTYSGSVTGVGDVTLTLRQSSYGGAITGSGTIGEVPYSCSGDHDYPEIEIDLTPSTQAPGFAFSGTVSSTGRSIVGRLRSGGNVYDASLYSVTSGGGGGTGGGGTGGGGTGGGGTGGGGTGGGVCCRVCTTGRACGDSCISRTRTCHQPRGCACNG